MISIRHSRFQGGRQNACYLCALPMTHCMEFRFWIEKGYISYHFHNKQFRIVAILHSDTHIWATYISAPFTILAKRKERVHGYNSVSAKWKRAANTEARRRVKVRPMSVLASLFLTCCTMRPVCFSSIFRWCEKGPQPAPVRHQVWLVALHVHPTSPRIHGLVQGRTSRLTQNRGATALGPGTVVVAPDTQSATPEFCLTTQHLMEGGGGADTPHSPLLSDWAKFSPGLQPIKNFLWRLRRKSV